MITRATFMKSLLGLVALPLALKAKPAPQDLTRNPCLDVQYAKPVRLRGLRFVGMVHDGYCFSGPAELLENPLALSTGLAQATLKLKHSGTVGWHLMGIEPGLGYVPTAYFRARREPA